MNENTKNKDEKIEENKINNSNNDDANNYPDSIPCVENQIVNKTEKDNEVSEDIKNNNNEKNILNKDNQQSKQEEQNENEIKQESNEEKIEKDADKKEEKENDNIEEKQESENKMQSLMNNELFENARKIEILKKGNDISMLNITYDYLFKVSLIGDSGTGKTSVIKRFVDNTFDPKTTSTIGIDFKIVSFDLGKKVYAKMQIWDTCGSERFKSLTASFLKTCSAFILVFDLTRKITLTNIESWINTIKENTKPKLLILLGNKSDLVNERKISNIEIQKTCEKFNVNYIETSAKTNDNVELLFKQVAYELYKDIDKKKQKNNNQQIEMGASDNIKVKEEENKKKKSGCC